MSDDTAPAASRTSPSHAESRPAQKTPVLSLVFGGAVACVLGFLAGQIDAIEASLGLGQSGELAATVDAQAETLEQQSAQIAELTERLAAAEAIEIPEVDLSSVETALAEQSGASTALAERIEALEKRPMTQGLSEEAVAAYQAELERLQASVQEQRAELEALVDEARSTESSAEERARLALARAALSRVITAVDSGAPYAQPLAELSAATPAEIPADLTAHADTGVPTLAALRDRFAANARAALSAARAEEGTSSVSGFLQRQLGVRSVEPREGSDPDAILSRAEAALRDGRLGDTLAEIDTLPEAAQAAMADWVSAAETRHAAMVAADDMMSALATN